LDRSHDSVAGITVPGRARTAMRVPAQTCRRGQALPGKCCPCP
jgi:hypothetical protein